MHIAERRLQRLRCKQDEKGQKYVFHNGIIHILVLKAMMHRNIYRPHQRSPSPGQRAFHLRALSLIT
jgi:hypothetical protein